MKPVCSCTGTHGPPALVVITGGPGAGKTAVLEVVRRRFCAHVAVLPESASILFGGGFPRRDGRPARHAAQRAIFRVQRELEHMVQEEARVAVALCDRGTLDGMAYWDGDSAELLADVGTDHARELGRYAAVIHLRTPEASRGYNNHQNPVRIETAEEARRIDERILGVWADHPRRTVIEPTDDFVDKLMRTLDAVRAQIPTCCRGAESAPAGRG
jgi:predicted ATPase